MLDKYFNFKDSEHIIYTNWETDKCFAPDMSCADSFAIMMPPPNVTGTLHLGHALDNTLPDILVRKARMQNKAALYQPGCDHASIAVHVVLERKLREEGKTRFDLGREKFMEYARAWKDESASTITGQLKQLGISCDWNSFRFTMDDHYAETVQNVFVELYNRGLIYRGQRLINWDPVMQTAVSDLEIAHKEVNGNLWHFKYTFSDGFRYEDNKTGISDGIVIATTRPETILADGAIAINPSDPRAKALVGKHVTVPIVNRVIPIIADDYVDPTFGSGMVKITAAHDFNDFEVYQRHKDNVDIPLINLMNANGTMNENCPADYVGLDRFAARKKIVADLTVLGFHIKTEEHVHNVGHAERDNTILEPFLTEQWYVKGKPLADKVLKAIASKEVSFVNTRDEKIIKHWLENIQDWCVSRQLWWGHRIPVWYNGSEMKVQTQTPNGEGWEQDEDILDTWFSSALWPFVTQGWPEKNDKLEKFYPGHAIMNGRDILPFWDMRMLMFGLELTGKVPFKTIYTHGLINDEHGQKMSKSKGNVVDPVAVMEQYGTDAVRMTVASITAADDMRWMPQKLEQYRNFVTKLWNASRFLEMNGVVLETSNTLPVQSNYIFNHWILNKFSLAATAINRHLDAYEFNLAADTLYHFIWNDWCDWYIELIKPDLKDNVPHYQEVRQFVGSMFEKILRLASPFIPFVTEEIWQNLQAGMPNSFLMTQMYSVNLPTDYVENSVKQAEEVIELISAVRQVRTIMNVPHKSKVSIRVKNADEELVKVYSTYMSQLNQLAKIKNIAASNTSAAEGDAIIVVNGVEYILELGGIIDMNAEKERIHKQLEKQQAEINKLEGLLKNPGFIAKAPPQVVAENQEKVVLLKQDIEKLQNYL